MKLIGKLVLYKNDLKELLGFCPSRLEYLVKHEGFPKPKQLSKRRVAWLRADVELWLQSRPAAEWADAA
jgi:prophage regulatory protein